MATVQDMIDMLQEIIEDGTSPDTELRGVFQPNYPLMTSDFTIYDGTQDSDDDEEQYVYIGIGDGYEYGTKKVYDDGEML